MANEKITLADLHQIVLAQAESIESVKVVVSKLEDAVVLSEGIPSMRDLLEEQTKVLSDLRVIVVNLQEKFDSNEAIVVLQEHLAEQALEIKGLKEQVELFNGKADAFEEFLSSQSEKIAEHELEIAGNALRVASASQRQKASIPSAPFIIDGKKYKFRIPVFRFAQQRYTAEVAQHDKDLLKKILSTKGQMLLKEVV